MEQCGEKKNKTLFTQRVQSKEQRTAAIFSPTSTLYSTRNGKWLKRSKKLKSKPGDEKISMRTADSILLTQ